MKCAAIYCLNFNNEVRKVAMTERFRLAGVSPILHPGVPVSDPRIAGRDLIPHTEKCWSCMYGHLDMIRDFVDNEKDPNAVFPPFSADWSITKEGKRCIVYPMFGH